MPRCLSGALCTVLWIPLYAFPLAILLKFFFKMTLPVLEDFSLSAISESSLSVAVNFATYIKSQEVGRICIFIIALKEAIFFAPKFYMKEK